MCTQHKSAGRASNGGPLLGNIKYDIFQLKRKNERRKRRTKKIVTRIFHVVVRPPNGERTNSSRRKRARRDYLRFLFSLLLFSFPNYVYLSPMYCIATYYRVVQSNLLRSVCAQCTAPCTVLSIRFHSFSYFISYFFGCSFLRRGRSDRFQP